MYNCSPEARPHKLTSVVITIVQRKQWEELGALKSEVIVTLESLMM